MRTAEAAGVLGIITTRGSANAFSPKTLRGSMGAGFRLPIWENAEFDEALDWAKKKKLQTICADINARTTYLEIDWRFDYLMVFGSEAHGLNEAERAQINHSFFIPMDNDVESLNLAVACGIVLFEAKNLQIKFADS
jgi:TrmH family RNA methyltransferase